MISKRRYCRGGSVRSCYVEAYVMAHRPQHQSGIKMKRKIRQTYLLFLVQKIKHVLHINESLLDHPGNKTTGARHSLENVGQMNPRKAGNARDKMTCMAVQYNWRHLHTYKLTTATPPSGQDFHVPKQLATIELSYERFIARLQILNLASSDCFTNGHLCQIGTHII